MSCIYYKIMKNFVVFLKFFFLKNWKKNFRSHQSPSCSRFIIIIVIVNIIVIIIDDENLIMIKQFISIYLPTNQPTDNNNSKNRKNNRMNKYLWCIYSDILSNSKKKNHEVCVCVCVWWREPETNFFFWLK